MPDIYVHTGDSNLRQNLQASWAAARDASTAGVIDSTATSYATVTQERRTGSQYSVRRYFFAVDTSGISIKPVSATFKIRGATNTGSNLILVKIDQSATGDASTNFVAEDFGKIDFTTPFSSEYTGTWSTSGYNEIALNDAALTEMLNFDVIKIALIGHDFDFLNVEPADGINRTSGGYTANASNPDNRPLISYVAGVAPTPQGTPSTQFGKDYTINSYNIDVLSTQYTRFTDQVPFSLGIPGPARLRGRENAPIVSTGKKKN